MAAMAPALTEAATEAHHRFKLATPSSSLSPSGTTDIDNSKSLNNNTKRKAFADDHGLDFRNNSRNEDRLKLVSPYRCLDAASRPPLPPESVKLQGSFSKHAVIKSHTILSHSLLDTGVIRAELVGGQPALEFSPGLLKTMSTSSIQSSRPSPPQPPVNGLAKKSAVNIRADSDLIGAEVAGKAIAAGLPRIGSNQVEDSSKLVSNSNITKSEVTGEASTLEELSTITEDLSKSEAARHPEFGENGIVKAGATSSTEGSAGGVSGNTDERKSSVSKTNTINILGAELHSRTLLAQTRQSEIQRRACRLRKRLEVVQAKQVERHVQQQLGGFVEQTVPKLPHLDCLKRQDGSLRNPQLVFACKSDSTSCKGGESTSETLTNFFKSSSASKGLEKFISSSDSKLRFSENAFDSDVTESSSGGESDLEEESLTKVDMEQYHMPVLQRSEWRWAIERAAIVSRWNWLQAHVSDLEYRIRQQTDIYRQIRANKGSVVLGDSPPPEDLSRLIGSSPDQSDCPPQTELKAIGASGKLEISVCSHSSLPKIVAKQVISPVSPVENVTSCSAPTESIPTKPCSHLKPVNGVINSVHSLLPDNSSTDSSDVEELLNKKQRLNVLPVPPDNTCIAARVRPLLTCKKRRLIRPNNIQPLNRKTQRHLSVRCNCDVTTSCIMCGSKNSESLENRYDMPMSERLALLDPCLHPVLSLSDDIPQSMHFQPVLKGHWQNKLLDKNKASKKLSLKHKGLLMASLSDPSRRARQKLANSIISSDNYAHNKNRTEKPFKQNLDDLLSVSKLESTPVQEKFLNKKRQRELSTELTEARQALSDMGSSYGSTISSHASVHSPLMRQLSTSSESSTQNTTNTQSMASILAARRRRIENSFDINNIVIPMSIAATTRVEKLQYKEILTPSWRIVDVKADSANHRFNEEDHDEMEDFSDAVFASRHTKYEEFERLRWTTWTASPVSAQRRGSRSYKSTDEHSTPQPGNTNPSTPQPASPDVSFHSLGDLPLTPSPCSPSAPPISPDTFYSSLSRESAGRASNEDTRCSTPDIGHEEQTVQPWEKRTFPMAFDPGTERESRTETSHRQTRNSRRSSGSSRGSKESESGALPSVQHNDKQRHSVPLRFTHT